MERTVRQRRATFLVHRCRPFTKASGQNWPRSVNGGRKLSGASRWRKRFRDHWPRRVGLQQAVLGGIYERGLVMIYFQPDLHALIGLGVTMIFGGVLVKPLIKHVGKRLGPLPPPSDETCEQWNKLTTMDTGGDYIGHVERPIFFASLWIPGAWPLLSSWLIFKLAFYWQSANLSAFPEKPPGWVEAEYLFVKRKLGTHLVTTALVGTGANIVLALIGVAVGKWTVL